MDFFVCLFLVAKGLLVMTYGTGDSGKGAGTSGGMLWAIM